MEGEKDKEVTPSVSIEAFQVLKAGFDTLTKRVDELETENVKLKNTKAKGGSGPSVEEFQMLTEVVEELLKKDSNKDAVSVSEIATKTPGLPRDSFKFNKKEYKFKVVGIRHEGKQIMADEALESQKLLKLFVEEYPNTVEEVK
jgi:hypothetical protein